MLSWEELEPRLQEYVEQHAIEAVKVAAWAGALVCLRFITENPEIAEQILKENREARG